MPSSYSFTFNVNGQEILTNGGSFTFTVNLNPSASEQALNVPVTESANSLSSSSPETNSVIHVCCNEDDDSDDDDFWNNMPGNDVVCLSINDNDSAMNKNGGRQSAGINLNNNHVEETDDDDAESQIYEYTDDDSYYTGKTLREGYRELVSTIRASMIKYPPPKKVSGGGGESSTLPSDKKGDSVVAKVKDGNSALESLDASYSPVTSNTLDANDYNQARGFN
jgi:hypothetical protein